MKFSKYNMAFTLLAIALLSGPSLTTVAAQTAPGQTTPRLGNKEVKELLANATTAEDHQKLAAYYRDKAHRSDAASQRFAKQAQFLESQSKPGVPSGAAKSYRYTSRQYAEDAWQAEVLAAEQEKLAKASQSKPEMRK